MRRVRARGGRSRLLDVHLLGRLLTR